MNFDWDTDELFAQILLEVVERHERTSLATIDRLLPRALYDSQYRCSLPRCKIYLIKMVISHQYSYSFYTFDKKDNYVCKFHFRLNDPVSLRNVSNIF